MSRSLLIVDDHEGVAAALAEMVRAWDCDPVHVAHSSREALAIADRERPDLITVDVDLGDDDGFELLARLRAEHPHRPALVLTGSGTAEVAATALRAGASGFVPKSEPPESLTTALQAALDGHVWLPLHLIGPVARALMQPVPPNDWEALVNTLSTREREVLELMVRGMSRREIASTLYISLNTVRTHVKNILAKLGVHASLEAVSLALRAGIRPDEGTHAQSASGTTIASSAPPREL